MIRESPTWPPTLVTWESVQADREIVERFVREFASDYDAQGVEAASLSAQIVPSSWDEERAVVLLRDGGGEPVGALGFELMMDYWELEWAYLIPAARHLGLIESAWSDIVELIHSYGYKFMGDDAGVVRCLGTVSPSGASLLRRLGIERTLGWGEPRG